MKIAQKCLSTDLLTPPRSVPEDYVDTRVEGLSERPVQSMDDVEELLEEGNKRRQGLGWSLEPLGEFQIGWCNWLHFCQLNWWTPSWSSRLGVATRFGFRSP